MSNRWLHSGFVRLPIALALCLLAGAAVAGTFPGNARVTINDSTGGLSWSTNANALTVSCWFKISIPSTQAITENMTILVNRQTGDESTNYSYLIRYNIVSNDVEFLARGTSGAFSHALVERPYLDRWYHVAIVRDSETVTGYLDGRQVFSSSTSLGDASNTDGVSVGGWATVGNGNYLFGEVQEVAIYQAALSQEFITEYMLRDQPQISELVGYYKLAYSSNSSDNLKNFAPVPPTGTGTATASGNVKFEEVNEAGEQSAFDSKKNGGRNAIAPLSGSFAWQQAVFSRPTPGVAFDFRIGYSSGNAGGGYKLGGYDPYASGPLGKGWRHTFEARAIPGQYFAPIAGIDTIGLMSWDGAIETWDLDYESFEYTTRHNEYRGELSLIGTICQWVTPDRVIYKFRHPFSGSTIMRGRLLEISDYNTNTVKVLWNESIGIITQVVDSAGGRYDFHYNAQYLLTNVSFLGWSANFEYDTSKKILTNKYFSGPQAYTNQNTSWTFSYTDDLLTLIRDPRGNTNVFNVYDKYGRVTEQRDALWRYRLTAYGVPSLRKITRTDAADKPWIEEYDRKGRLLAQTDPCSSITSYTYDDYGNRTSITEPLGWKTFFGYDSRANVLAKTNAMGQVTTWTYHSVFNKPLTQTDALRNTTTYEYDAAGNLRRQYDALGDMALYTYKTNGLVEASTDANGNISRFAYNADGFLASKTDPANNITSYGRNEFGWVMAETNALNKVTAYSYDINGNVVQTVDPLLRVLTKTYDANGNVTRQSDAQTPPKYTYYFYDAANQKTQMVDRANSRWSYTYTLRGEIETVTDPLSNIASNVYDNANRLKQVFDPLGNSTQTEYDANGNKIATIDKLGRRWDKTYDHLNRVIAESNPRGDTKLTSYDVVGRIKTITTPNGYPSSHEYDPRGRLTKWVDAEGFQWKYMYDGNGNILDIEDALHGHYVMTYSNRNERVLERNQDNKEWRYTYDELLRLKTQTDPNGLVITLTYDDVGRVTTKVYSTGRSDSLSYDNNSNPTDVTRFMPPSSSTTTHLEYDAMDRVTKSRDTFGKDILYSYDSLGRVNTLTYPDGKVLTNGYDQLSRLVFQQDWAGRQLTYGYDKADRLIRRMYPNSIIQTNAFDEAGRLTSLAYKNTQQGTSLTNGLVGFWKFDETSGSTASDSSNNGNAGTVSGATWTNGHVLGALEFNGTDNYVTVSDAASLDLTNFTLSAWVKFTSVASWQTVLNKGAPRGNTTAEYHNYVFYIADGNRVVVYYKDQAGTVYKTESSPLLTTNTWYHIAATRDAATGQLAVFIDGVQRGSNTFAATPNTQNQPLRIGVFDADTGAERFEGIIDELRVHNRALSPAEVYQVYLGGVSITNLNPVIALTYAYDRNGNKTSSTEQGTFDWPQPSQHDETAQYTPSGRLIDKLDAAQTSNNWTYIYDASGNMTNAVSTGGESFAFTYDEDNRVLALQYDAFAMATKTITNRYDALGRRISRTTKDGETRYALGLQGKTERILCDFDSSGQITAYYIHGPDLCYKVNPGPPETVTCYHADAQANIIALTDGGGANTAQYAYTPYGRSLPSSTADSNPYRFVGSQGVMEEQGVPGLYFMRARYYSAETGAFLSTDPIKHIGPTWRPVAYAYAGGNPLGFADPKGEYLITAIAETYDWLNTLYKLKAGETTWAEVTEETAEEEGLARLAAEATPVLGDVVTVGLVAYGIYEDWQAGTGIPGWVKRNTECKPLPSLIEQKGTDPNYTSSGDWKPPTGWEDFPAVDLTSKTVDTKVADDVKQGSTVNAGNYADTLNSAQGNGSSGNSTITSTTTSDTGQKPVVTEEKKTATTGSRVSKVWSTVKSWFSKWKA